MACRVPPAPPLKKHNSHLSAPPMVDIFRLLLYNVITPNERTESIMKKGKFAAVLFIVFFLLAVALICFWLTSKDTAAEPPAADVSGSMEPQIVVGTPNAGGTTGNGSSSGSTTPMTSTYSRSTGAAAGPHSSLSSSAFTRSGERFFSRGAFPRRAAAVPGSISNPSAAANRSPRRMRNPSSVPPPPE